MVDVVVKEEVEEMVMETVEVILEEVVMVEKKVVVEKMELAMVAEAVMEVEKVTGDFQDEVVKMVDGVDEVMVESLDSVVVGEMVEKKVVVDLDLEDVEVVEVVRVLQVEKDLVVVDYKMEAAVISMEETGEGEMVGVVKSKCRTRGNSNQTRFYEVGIRSPF